jgi:hypothetical protein
VATRENKKLRLTCPTKSKTKASPRRAAHQPRWLIESAEEIAARRKTEQEEEQKRDHDLLIKLQKDQAAAQKVQAVASVATFLLTVVIGFVSFRQFQLANENANTARSAAKTASDTLTIDQRAWLGVKDITLTHPLVIGRPIDISINTFNTGKSPALDAGLVETSIGDSEIPKPEEKKAPSNDRSSVAPNNDEVFYASATVDPQVIVGLQKKIIRFYVRGRLVYKDIFDKQHETRFCMYYPTGWDTLNLFNCSAGNFMN